MCIHCKAKGLPPPTPLIEVDIQTVLHAVQLVCPKANIYLSDSIYSTTTIDELQRFLKDDKTNEYRYVSEFFDCDDFSYRLLGMVHNVEWGALPFGLLWTEKPGGNHAVNVFVDNKYTVWVIEPQTDQVFRLPSDWMPYLVII